MDTCEAELFNQLRHKLRRPGGALGLNLAQQRIFSALKKALHLTRFYYYGTTKLFIAFIFRSFFSRDNREIFSEILVENGADNDFAGHGPSTRLHNHSFQARRWGPAAARLEFGKM